MKVMWKDGFRASVPAQVAYDTIQELYQQGKGTAKDLVDASRPEDAPLHRMFEWNDSIAAEKYREVQGRELIRHIVVINDEYSDGKEPQAVRAFMQYEERSGNYEPTLVIMSDEEKRDRLLEIAKAELQRFKLKYAALKELEKVFKAIDSVA